MDKGWRICYGTSRYFGTDSDDNMCILIDRFINSFKYCKWSEKRIENSDSHNQKSSTQIAIGGGNKQKIEKQTM